MALRSILGGSRVKKKSASTKQRSSPSSSWTSALPRSKPVSKPRAKHDNRGTTERLDDLGPARLLPPPPLPTPSASNTTSSSNASSISISSSSGSTGIRDPLQAHESILGGMFDPLPARAAGMSSTRIASVLRARAVLPRVTSASHLRAVLLACGAVGSPAAAEREVARAIATGRLRRVVVPTRGNLGELVVLAAELEGMLGKAGKSGGDGESGNSGRGRLGEGVKEGFVRWLRGNPAATRMTGEELLEGVAGLGQSEVDELVRAGFLTAERHSMVSLETVSRAAAGTVAAVGGEGVVHAAGGTGVRSTVRSGSRSGSGSGEFSVAVPGSGVFLKLVTAALEHLADLLRKNQYREMPESDLREKWDGGVVDGSEAALAKRARGEFAGVLPGRTKKWKELQGLAFDWVLREAVGAGLVEVFETRSVGRGVRLT
ncbi:Meiotically up-regulated gene 51 protein [Madurella mycetomatis]|uniref:Meiotically up-regulated gene 51 protein n=1 Tax=Madurella mycetomatis TaxID=100816 RepID=A0A175WAE6_9PEZI|nr:Meiotically up-regulated gene 51 protein [Madurella mycetomatis]